MDPRYPRYLVDSIFFGGTRNFFFGGGGGGAPDLFG